MNGYKIILFDGVCNFCNYWVNFIIDRDKKDNFKFAALQSDAGQKYLKKFGLNTKDFDTFVLVDGDVYYTKSTAALKIAKKINSPLKVLSIFLILPKFIRDPLYNLIARNRYKIFGKRDSCRLPTKEERAKFL